MTFALQIQSTRHTLGLTQAELAGLLDVSSQTVSNWECGANEPWPRQQVDILGKLLALYNPVQRQPIIDRI